MYTRNGNPVVVMLVLVVTLSSCAVATPYSANVEDLNGTWVERKELLSSSRIRERNYSWGVGKRIVETTLEIEVEEGRVLMPGGGMFYIQQIRRNPNGSITVDVKGTPGEEVGEELRLVFYFLDRDMFWIECAVLEGQFAVGRNNPWYRLSGPPR